MRLGNDRPQVFVTIDLEALSGRKKRSVNITLVVGCSNSAKNNHIKYPTIIEVKEKITEER